MIYEYTENDFFDLEGLDDEYVLPIKLQISNEDRKLLRKLAKEAEKLIDSIEIVVEKAE